MRNIICLCGYKYVDIHRTYNSLVTYCQECGRETRSEQPVIRPEIEIHKTDTSKAGTKKKFSSRRKEKKSRMIRRTA